MDAASGTGRLAANPRQKIENSLAGMCCLYALVGYRKLLQKKARQFRPMLEGTMRLIQIAGASLLVVLAAATPTLAADMPIKAPVAKAVAVAPVFNWTGWYAGLHAGYGWGNVTISDLEENNKMRGWLAGGQLGYNVQTGSWVWGAEIDGAWTGIEVTDTNLRQLCDRGLRQDQ